MEIGLPEKQPDWKICSFKSHKPTLGVTILSIMSFLPPYPPIANPPPRIFPKQTRSGFTPKYSSAPPKANLKFVTTSSKIKGISFSLVTSLTALRNSNSAETHPRPKAEIGSIITAPRLSASRLIAESVPSISL